MSYAFYPADLLLPPLTSYRTAVSMLMLLLAGIIALCYARKVMRDSASMPDPYVASDLWRRRARSLCRPSNRIRRSRVLEAHLLAVSAIPALQKATGALARVRISITGAILADPVIDRAAIQEALVDSLFIGTDRRPVLNTA